MFRLEIVTRVDVTNTLHEKGERQVTTSKFTGKVVTLNSSNVSVVLNVGVNTSFFMPSLMLCIWYG